nr:3-deoxy-7-phosphoheptulonate synthase [Arthrobacter sp. JCM 19049]
MTEVFRTPLPGSSVAGPATDPDLDLWRNLPIAQQPTWSEHADYSASIAELGSRPPLVFAGEVDILRARLAAAAQGKAFLLQGGDCAETFDGATADKISARVRTILQMAVVLTYGSSMPVIKMGRMAGQFAKPRSSNDETRDGVTLPAFRGEIVNGFDFTPESRAHDPKRMVTAYNTSAATLNLIRAFTQGGFADLRSVHSWNQGSWPTRRTPPTSSWPGRSIRRSASWTPAARTSRRSSAPSSSPPTRPCCWTTSGR